MAVPDQDKSGTVVPDQFVVLADEDLNLNRENTILITIITWLLESRAVALLFLLLIQLNASVSVADDELGLTVNSMPLSIFASAIEDGMSIPLEVDESIADFTVDGQFNGTIQTLLDSLHEQYGISYAESNGGYRLWRDSDFSSSVSYQFQLSDMGIVSFVDYLSQATGYQLIADPEVDVSVNGAFNGTLREIINSLSHQYPVLFHVSGDTISVVPESSFEKRVVMISHDNYSSEAFLTDLRTKLPPGNFVTRQDDQLIVGGHPEFVRATELQLQIDMLISSSPTPAPVLTQYPAVTDPEDPMQAVSAVEAILVEIVQSSMPVAMAETMDTIPLVGELPVNTSLVSDVDSAGVSRPYTDIDARTQIAAQRAGAPQNPDAEIIQAVQPDVATVETMEPIVNENASSISNAEVVDWKNTDVEVSVAMEPFVDMADLSKFDAALPYPDAALAVATESVAATVVVPEVQEQVLVVIAAAKEETPEVVSVDQIPGFYDPDADLEADPE